MPDLTPDEQLIRELCDDRDVWISWLNRDGVENERERLPPLERWTYWGVDQLYVPCSCRKTHKALSVEMTRYPCSRRQVFRFVGQCRTCGKIYWSVARTPDPDGRPHKS